MFTGTPGWSCRGRSFAALGRPRTSSGRGSQKIEAPLAGHRLRPQRLDPTRMLRVAAQRRRARTTDEVNLPHGADGRLRGSQLQMKNVNHDRPARERTGAAAMRLLLLSPDRSPRDRLRGLRSATDAHEHSRRGCGPIGGRVTLERPRAETPQAPGGGLEEELPIKPGMVCRVIGGLCEQPLDLSGWAPRRARRIPPRAGVSRPRPAA